MTRLAWSWRDRQSWSGGLQTTQQAPFPLFPAASLLSQSPVESVHIPAHSHFLCSCDVLRHSFMHLPTEEARRKSTNPTMRGSRGRSFWRTTQDKDHHPCSRSDSYPALYKHSSLTPRRQVPTGVPILQIRQLRHEKFNNLPRSAGMGNAWVFVNSPCVGSIKKSAACYGLNCVHYPCPLQILC